MKIERNKIIEATEAELMEHYLKEGYDDIYSFREYLRLMVEAGVKILEEEDGNIKHKIDNMTSEQFFQKVVQMRDAQKMYFRTKRSEYLKESKDLEKQVDAEIERVKTVEAKRREPSLF